MFRYWIFLIILIIFSQYASAEISINEIMYDFSGSDNNQEYIEVYSDRYVNLSKYIIEDHKSDDALECVFSFNSSYSLIVEEGFNYTGINASVYSVGATIGDNLNNEWDIIVLKNESGKIIDAVSYYSSWGGDGNGNSLCKIPDNNGIWKECSASPGKNNLVSEDTFGCDWSVNLILNGTVFNDLSFKVKVIKLNGEGKANISVKTWIEDSSGKITKEYGLWNADNALNSQTSGEYNPNLAKGDAYFIKTNITNISCSDNALLNNFAASTVFIVDEGIKGTNPLSDIRITDIDDSAKFGDVIDVGINVYRGDTTKYAVYAYIEDDGGKKVSEKITLHFKNKFTNYSLTVPLQTDLNCNEKFDEDDYYIVLEGFDIVKEEKIELSGKSSDCGESKEVVCETTSEDSSSSTIRSGSLGYSLKEIPSEVKNDKEFNVKVELSNNEDEDIPIDIWSYVYRGSKSYSGEREENKQSFVLGSGESKTVELKNVVEGASPGEYNLKVKMIKNNQKTSKDITEQIIVSKEETEKETNEITGNTIVDYIRWNPVAVYESSTFKSKKLIPYLIILAFGIVAGVMAMRKE